MKKLVILFILSVVPHAVYAATATTCADCYKCVAYSGDNCIQCEYDPAYCAQVCPTGKVWQNGECVCASMCVGEQDPDTCECIGCGLHVACADGEVFNDETCECEKIKCKSGWYHNGTGCAACPGNTSTGDGIYDDSALLRISCGVNSSNYGANGITDCYMSAKGAKFFDTCEYSDDTGAYGLTENCYYSSFNVAPIN